MSTFLATADLSAQLALAALGVAGVAAAALGSGQVSRAAARRDTWMVKQAAWLAFVSSATAAIFVAVNGPLVLTYLRVSILLLANCSPGLAMLNIDSGYGTA